MSGSGEGGTSGWVKWFACGCGGCLGIILLVVLLGAGVGGIAFFSVTKSDAYTVALERASSSPEVVELLGEPIKPGIFPQGSIQINGPDGEADLRISISGPSARATIVVDAIKAGGEWQFRVLEVHPDDGGEVIDLLPLPAPGDEGDDPASDQPPEP